MDDECEDETGSHLDDGDSGRSDGDSWLDVVVVGTSRRKKGERWRGKW